MRLLPSAVAARQNCFSSRTKAVVAQGWSRIPRVLTAATDWPSRPTRGRSVRRLSFIRTFPHCSARRPGRSENVIPSQALRTIGGGDSAIHPTWRQRSRTRWPNAPTSPARHRRSCERALIPQSGAAHPSGDGLNQQLKLAVDLACLQDPELG